MQSAQKAKTTAGARRFRILSSSTGDLSLTFTDPLRAYHKTLYLSLTTYRLLLPEPAMLLRERQFNHLIK